MHRKAVAVLALSLPGWIAAGAALVGAARAESYGSGTLDSTPYSQSGTATAPPVQPLPADASAWPGANAMSTPPPSMTAPVKQVAYQDAGPAYTTPAYAPVYNPPAYSQPVYTAPSAPPVVVTTAPPPHWTESSWYTRVDYFHWNERMDGFDLVNEDGELTTIGYERRIGIERFRAEIFGGQVHYDGFAQDPDTFGLDPLSSHTNYLGVRGEYELIAEPDWMPRMNFLTGIGTKFWIRELPDDFSQSGFPVWGYEETWWTIYPYIGLERRRLSYDDVEFYWSSRVGITAVTYQMASFGELPLWPKPGVTTQFEAGWRGEHLFASGYFETMNWGESGVVRGWLQPASWMYTVGLKAGFVF